MLPSNADRSEANWPLTNSDWSEAAVRSAGRWRREWWEVGVIGSSLCYHAVWGYISRKEAWDRQPWWKQPWKLPVTFWFLRRRAALISRHYSSLSFAVSKEAGWKLADKRRKRAGVTGILWTWKLYLGHKSSESQTSLRLGEGHRGASVRHCVSLQQTLGWMVAVNRLTDLSELLTKYVGAFFSFLLFLPLKSPHALKYTVCLKILCVSDVTRYPCGCCMMEHFQQFIKLEHSSQIDSTGGFRSGSPGLV